MSLGFVRSRLLLFFAYYGVSKLESAQLIYSLEKADKDFKQHVNLHDFASLFCHGHEDCFMALWQFYRPILFPNSLSSDVIVYLDPKRDGLYPASRPTTQQRLKSKSSDSNKESAHSQEVDFFSFVSFLFYFVPLSPEKFAHMIFWLTLWKVKKPINLEALQDLSCAFDSESQRSSKHYERSVSKKHKQIAHALRFANFAEFDAQKFQVYDMRLNGVWMKPLNNMVAVLRRKLLGAPYWTRISHCCAAVSGDYRSRLSMLANIGASSTDDDDALVDRRDNGERKLARKLVRKHVRVLMDFEKMPLSLSKQDDDSRVYPSSQFSLISYFTSGFSKVGSIFLARIPSTAPVGPGVPASELPASAAASAAASDLIEKPMALNVLYKSSLTEPMEFLFAKAEDALAKGRKLLEQPEGESYDVEEEEEDDVDALEPPIPTGSMSRSTRGPVAVSAPADNIQESDEGISGDSAKGEEGKE